MIHRIDGCCGCFLGNGRNNNEDNFYFNGKRLPVVNHGLKSPISFLGDTTNPVVLAVFDGMGGEARGEEAAFCASEAFADEVKRLDELVLSGKQFLLDACQKANSAVCRIAEDNKIGTMGTTVASLFLFQDEAVACNVGDSRAYRVRGSTMLQISQDHTDEHLLRSMGIDKKPVLLQYIGLPENEVIVTPTVLKGDIQTGDTYVLCSDGVSDYVSAQQLYELIQSSESAEQIVEQTLQQVRSNDGQDNATIIAVRIVE